MNQINPYRRNCEIMRRFFAKPIFLITGIVLLILVIANSVFSFLSDQIPVFDFISIATGIAFLVFFFKARCKKDFVSFGAPTTLMDVVSIVGIVFSGLVTAVGGLFSILFLLPNVSLAINNSTISGAPYSSIGKSIHDFLAVISPVVMLFGIILLLYYIGMKRMTLSFKKSLSTVYLQRKGSVMFGVMSLILTVVSGLFYVVLFSYTFTTIDHLEAMSVCLIILEYTFSIIVFVLYAIIAFKYNLYIKKLSSSIETGRPLQYTPPETEETNEYNPTLDFWAESVDVSQVHNQATATRPVEFTPQAVFGNSKPVEPRTEQPEINLPKNDNQNPYLINNTPLTKRCARCGKENPNINIFCGNCGNRL